MIVGIRMHIVPAKVDDFVTRGINQIQNDTRWRWSVIRVIIIYFAFVYVQVSGHL